MPQIVQAILRPVTAPWSLAFSDRRFFGSTLLLPATPNRFNSARPRAALKRRKVQLAAKGVQAGTHRYCGRSAPGDTCSPTAHRSPALVAEINDAPELTPLGLFFRKDPAGVREIQMPCLDAQRLLRAATRFPRDYEQVLEGRIDAPPHPVVNVLRHYLLRLPCGGFSMWRIGERSMWPSFSAQFKARCTTVMRPRFMPGFQPLCESTQP